MSEPHYHLPDGVIALFASDEYWAQVKDQFGDLPLTYRITDGVSSFLLYQLPPGVDPADLPDQAEGITVYRPGDAVPYPFDVN